MPTSKFTLTTAQLGILNTMLGTVIKTPDQLIELLRNSQTIRLGDGVEIELPAEDLYAIQQLAIGMGASSMDEYIREFIGEAVQQALYGSYVMGRR